MGTPRPGEGARSGVVVGPSDAERLAAAERRIAAVTRVLDDLVSVPGTGRRFGLDPIIGLIPVIGDASTALVSLWLIAEAARFRMPRIVLARMVVNTLVDFAIGAIPILGDVIDFTMKPSSRNLALFRRYAADPVATTRDQRSFFAGLALILIGTAWFVITVLDRVLRALAEAL
jgi:hypothetical protein